MGWEDTSVRALGRHLIVELFGCSPEALSNETLIRGILLQAADKMGSTVVGNQFHSFSGGGVTGVVIIAESHISIHTWPEKGYAALDIFTCGRLDPWLAYRVIVEKLMPNDVNFFEVKRGINASEIASKEGNETWVRKEAR